MGKKSQNQVTEIQSDKVKKKKCQDCLRYSHCVKYNLENKSSLKNKPGVVY